MRAAGGEKQASPSTCPPGEQHLHLNWQPGLVTQRTLREGCASSAAAIALVCASVCPSGSCVRWGRASVNICRTRQYRDHLQDKAVQGRQRRQHI